MNDQTGSLDEKLRRKERAEEAVFFGKRDRALVEHLRSVKADTQRRKIRELTHMRCPDCGEPLERVALHGVTVEQCPERHGLWMTESELHALAKRERDSWIGRYFYRPRLKSD
jgi:uncharacterized protein with PIN domain